MTVIIQLYSCRPGQKHRSGHLPPRPGRVPAYSLGFGVIGTECSVQGLSLTRCLSLSLSLCRSLHGSRSSIFFVRISLAVLVCPKQSVGVQKSSDATGIAHPCAVIWTVHPRLRDLVPWTNKLSTRVRAKSRLLAGPGTVCPATREPSACSKVRPCQRSLGAASHGG